MARFYGDLKGQSRTAATRRGGSDSGVSAHVRGWEIGARVEVRNEDGQDTVSIYATGGSHDPHGVLVMQFQYGKAKFALDVRSLAKLLENKAVTTPA